METIIIISVCLILFSLHRVYKKLESLDDNFNSWYVDWQKKYDPYIPTYGGYEEEKDEA